MRWDSLGAGGWTTPMLLNPPADSWPHVPRQLRTASATASWNKSRRRMWLAGAGLGLSNTGQKGEIKSSPLLVDGVLYFTVVDNVWAVRCAFRAPTLHYTHPPNNGLHIGSRGVGMYKNWLYFLVPDGHLVSLNANDGSVRWIVQVADVTKGYWTSLAPLIGGQPPAGRYVWRLRQPGGLSSPRSIRKLARRSGSGTPRRPWERRERPPAATHLDDRHLRS